MSLSKRLDRGAFAIAAVFWLIYLALLPLETPLNALLARFVTLRSEYTFVEQLAKLYVLVMLLVSIHAYARVTQPVEVKLSIAFFLFSVALYLSESNMITEATRPVFGALGVLCIGALLWARRSWVALIAILMGAIAVFLGACCDAELDQSGLLCGLLPRCAAQLAARIEESSETVGNACFCLSAILCFRDSLRRLLAGKIKIVLATLLMTGVATTGNGWLHHRYPHSSKLQLVALGTTLVGFLGLLAAHSRLGWLKSRRGCLDVTHLNIFLFVLLVLLPSVYGPARSSVALLVWLPLMGFLARYLWRCHETIVPDNSAEDSTNGGFSSHPPA